MSRSFGIILLALTVGPAAQASDRRDAPAASPVERVILAAQLSPRATLQPSDRRVLVRVEPHADNRVLRLALEADDFYRSTDIPLDGANAPAAHFVTWRAVPPGPYVFTVTVYGSLGARGQRVERAFGLDVTEGGVR